MGEGSAAFLLKRLADAERDGDRVYAVVRGLGGSSDGKGKGITAPNPIGQQLATARAWQNAGLDPTTAGLIEAHGTSTKVGDVVEVESLDDRLQGRGEGLDRPGVGEEQRRPPEGRRRGRGPAEGRLGGPREDAAADAARPPAQPRHRLRRDAVRSEPRAARVEAGERHAAAVRRLRLRLRRDQLPRRARGARARRAHEGAAAGPGGGAGVRPGDRRSVGPRGGPAAPARPAGARGAVRGRPAQGGRRDARRASRTATCRPSPCRTRPTSRPASASRSTTRTARSWSSACRRPRRPSPSTLRRPGRPSRRRASSGGAGPPPARSPSSSPARAAST